MQQIYSNQPYQQLFAVDYAPKRPVLYLSTQSHVEVYQLGFLKLLNKISLEYAPTTMAASNGILSISSSHALYLYKDAVQIAKIQLNFSPIGQIFKCYQLVQKSNEFKQNFYFFDCQLRILKIEAQIGDNLPPFLLTENDFDISSINEYQQEQEFDQLIVQEVENHWFISFNQYFAEFNCATEEFDFIVEINEETVQKVTFDEQFVCDTPIQQKHSIQSFAVQKTTHFVALVTQSNLFVVNSNMSAKRLQLLNIKKDFQEFSAFYFDQNQIYCFGKNSFEQFDLKSKIFAQKTPLAQRNKRNELYGTINLTQSSGQVDSDVTFLLIQKYCLQVYNMNILKMERLVPGACDYVYFKHDNVFSSFDWNLRYLAVNLESRNVVIQTQDQKAADSFLRLESENFSFQSAREFLQQDNSLYAILQSNNNESVARFDLSSGKYVYFNAPNGYLNSIIRIQKQQKLLADKHLSFDQKSEIMKDYRIPQNDIISFYSVRNGILSLVSKNQLGLYYSQTATLISECVLPFDALACKIFDVSNKMAQFDTETENFYQFNEADIESVVLVFDSQDFMILNAVTGQLIKQQKFSAALQEVLESAESIKTFDNYIVIVNYQKLIIIKVIVSANTILFELLRERVLEDIQIQNNYILCQNQKIYFSCQRALLFYDLKSSEVFQIGEFPRVIKHFDIHYQLFIISFVDFDGVYFYAQEVGNNGKLLGRTQDVAQPSESFSNDILRGEKMIEYLASEKGQIRKVQQHSKKQYQNFDQGDFLKEEDVLFCDKQIITEMLQKCDIWEFSGILYLIGKYRKELMSDEEIQSVIKRRQQELKDLLLVVQEASYIGKAIVEDM